jgi:hypothetical protein
MSVRLTLWSRKDISRRITTLLHMPARPPVAFTRTLSLLTFPMEPPNGNCGTVKHGKLGCLEAAKTEVQSAKTTNSAMQILAAFIWDSAIRDAARRPKQ